MLKKKFLFIVIFLLALSPIFAQTGAKKVYTLKDAVIKAMSGNYDIKLSESELKLSDQELIRAFGKYLPSLNFNMAFNHNMKQKEIKGVDRTSDFYNMGLGASVSLFDGFSREANYSRAQKGMDASKLGYEQTKKNVILDVYREYINYIKNSQIARIRRENLEEGKKELERIRAQYDAGLIQKGVVYAQEADLANNEIQLIRAENDINTAKARLLQVMGMNPDEEVDFDLNSFPNLIKDEEVKQFRGEIGTFNQAVNTALENRLDYASQKLLLESAKLTKDMATGAYYPSLTANGGWNWGDSKFGAFSDKAYFNVGFNLSVPIFQNYNIDYQVQSAQFAIDQKLFELKKFEQSLRSSVQIAYLNLESSEKQLSVAQYAVRASEQNYESTKERLTVGATNINDLIQANTQLVTSQINKLNAVYSYILAKKEIEFALGKLDFAY